MVELVVGFNHLWVEHRGLLQHKVLGPAANSNCPSLFEQPRLRNSEYYIRLETKFRLFTPYAVETWAVVLMGIRFWEYESLK